MSDTVGIIGAGTMGNGIAYVAASHGHAVVMYDVQLPLAQRGLDKIRATLQRHVEKGRIDQAELQATLDRVRLTTDLADLAHAALAIEAVPEDMALKRDIFHTLDHLCLPETLLCSNTSSLSITALGGVTKRPDRVAGLHFFNPAPMMALVEVVRGHQTSDETIGQLVALARRWGKTPVIARDTPGFIVNRVARPFYGEALRLLDHRIADVATIDRIVKAAGFKMGPFELLDLIGLDVNLAVTQSIHDAYFQEPRFRPHPLQQRMVDAGLLGRKSGQGFYEYPTVQNWRDALVTSTVPASGASGTAPAAITAYFNWDIKPDGTEFSNAIVVTRGGAAVAGTISHDSATQSLTFTPSSPLAAGTYTVTIDHVVSLTVQNNGIKIRTPYVFSFTVN